MNDPHSDPGAWRVAMRYFFNRVSLFENRKGAIAMLMSYAVDEFCRFAKSVEVTGKVEDDFAPTSPGRILAVLLAARECSCTYAQLWQLHVEGDRLFVLWGGLDEPVDIERQAVEKAWGGEVEHHIAAEDGTAAPPWLDVPTTAVGLGAAAAAAA